MTKTVAKLVRPFSTRLQDVEHRMIEELARVDGISASDVVRMLVRRAYTARFGDVEPKARKKR